METERIPALTLDDLRKLQTWITAEITLRETHTLKSLRELKERISREITAREQGQEKIDLSRIDWERLRSSWRLHQYLEKVRKAYGEEAMKQAVEMARLREN